MLSRHRPDLIYPMAVVLRIQVGDVLWFRPSTSLDILHFQGIDIRQGGPGRESRRQAARRFHYGDVTDLAPSRWAATPAPNIFVPTRLVWPAILA